MGLTKLLDKATPAGPPDFVIGLDRCLSPNCFVFLDTYQKLIETKGL